MRSLFAINFDLTVGMFFFILQMLGAMASIRLMADAIIFSQIFLWGAITIAIISVPNPYGWELFNKSFDELEEYKRGRTL